MVFARGFHWVLYIICISSCFCLGSDTIPSGKSLFPNQTIISKEEKFELGFFFPDNSTDFYVGIWYKNIPVRTIVWVANRNNPIPYANYNSSRLEFSKGGLFLSFNSEVLEIARISDATEAVILETGNFVITSVSGVVWQSFDYPTDTWLPGGKVGFSRIDSLETKLVSWRNFNEPAEGKFSFGMIRNGGAELFIWRNSSQEWRSGTYQGGAIFLFPGKYFNFSYISTDDAAYFRYNSFNKAVLSRIVIGLSGTLTVQVWVEADQKWLLLWGQPSDHCRLYNYCGANAICDINAAAACTCLVEFAPKFCQTSWMSSAKPRGKGNGKGRNLAAALSAVTVMIVAGALIFFLHLKFKRKALQRRFQNLVLLDLNPTGPANNQRTEVKTQRGELENKDYELPKFSFSSIIAATNNFSARNKLGEGGFGPVYKGELANGQFVAVKRLSKMSGQGLEEFRNETELIAKLQHRNLVRILGCCIQEDEKILIYEYMPNKSLDSFLFDPTKKELLDWRRRVQIIEGIAQGLLYLHQYSRLRIIHRDLKAGNILLDGDMKPKISDFGMARIFGGNDSQANTKRIVGTYGYMSPEYVMGGTFSIKSDVFAFGVLLLEILSGKKGNGLYSSDSSSLLGLAWKLWQDNKTIELLDPVLEVSSSSSFVPLRFTHVGLLCVQESPDERPTMLEVVAMLNNEQTTLATPQHPAFTARSINFTANPAGNQKVEIHSVNETTFSLMVPR